MKVIANPTPPKETIYQLKVALKYVTPPVWRRFQVRGRTTLAGVHRALQIVMGWTDSHLHEFEIAADRYGMPGPDSDYEVADERDFHLEQVVPIQGLHFTYRYDFGDGWEHTLYVEKILPPEPGQRYPRCLAGQRACPPDDVGGSGGYAHFLEALQNPADEEHGEYLEWIGGEFDPEAFDLEEVNHELARMHVLWAPQWETVAGTAAPPAGDLDRLLWTADDAARFARHPDTPLRFWALERLTTLFPDRAGDALIPLLGDPDGHLVLQASEFLAGTGDRERYGPILMEYLCQAHGEHVGYLALALGRLHYEPALPIILETMARELDGPPTMPWYSLWRVIQAAGLLGGGEARTALWKHLQTLTPAHPLHPAILGALLDAARPEDVTATVQAYRSWPVAENPDPYLEQLAGAADASRLVYEIRQVAARGLPAALQAAYDWLASPPRLSTRVQMDLQRAFRHRHLRTAEVLLAAARQLVQERGDDTAGWRAAWEDGARLSGYPRRTLCTLLILEALAADPAPTAPQRQEEAALGLALLCQLSVDHDDRRTLDTAPDRQEALLDILLDARQPVLPDIVEQAAALGPQILPELLAALDPHDWGWGTLRAAQTIAQLARRYPGSCGEAIPLLIEMLHEEQGDYLCEACHDALAAIGPVAVPAMAAHLADGDGTRQIYLTGALERIPTERAAQAILAALDQEAMELDEMSALALADIGSASAIEPLYALWPEAPDFMPLTEALLILCQLHHVDKPELPEWRRDVIEVNEWQDSARQNDPGGTPAAAFELR
jgi:hypothetical protein